MFAVRACVHTASSDLLQDPIAGWALTNSTQGGGVLRQQLPAALCRKLHESFLLASCWNYPEEAAAVLCLSS